MNLAAELDGFFVIFATDKKLMSSQQLIGFTVDAQHVKRLATSYAKSVKFSNVSHFQMRVMVSNFCFEDQNLISRHC